MVSCFYSIDKAKRAITQEKLTLLRTLKRQCQGDVKDFGEICADNSTSYFVGRLLRKVGYTGHKTTK